MTSTIVLSFPFFCSNKGFIGTFIGFRPYLRDLLRMQKSTQSLDMTNCGDEEPLKVFLSNLPIFSCWKCYTIESLFGKMSSGLTLLSNSGFSRLLMLVQGVPTSLEWVKNNLLILRSLRAKRATFRKNRILLQEIAYSASFVNCKIENGIFQQLCSIYLM